jgi:hypothetical protein
MEDPALEEFRVIARRHNLEEPPPEVRARLLQVFSTWASERRPAPIATPVRRFVAELVRDLGGTAAVAGARGGGGSRQLLHHWPDGDVTWAVQQPTPEVLRVVGQILSDEGPETRWQVSCVVEGSVAARVDADASGEFDFSVPVAPSVAVHLHHDEVTVVCGPIRTGA